MKNVFHKYLFLQLFRFLIVGIAVFLADYLFLIIFVEFFGLHYLLGSMLSFLIACSINYDISMRFVFRRRSNLTKRQSLVVFFVLSFIGLILTEFLMYMFVSWVGMQYYVAKIFVTVVVMLWNFVSKKVCLE